MTLKEIPSYRVVCDGSDCEASPSDDSEYYCWAQPDGALDDLSFASGWYTSKDGKTHYCEKHAPRCSCMGCTMCSAPHRPGQCVITLVDDEFGNKCEDCSDGEPVVQP